MRSRHRTRLTDFRLNLEYDRLDGDYAIMAEFMLGQLRDSAENVISIYSDLKAANWQNFLNIDRLAKDQAQGYKETEAMFKQDLIGFWTAISRKSRRRDAELIDKAQQLDIKNRYRQQLSLTLKDSQQNQ